MNWSDESFLISKNRYSENSLISEIYTKDHGKVSGIIFGGTSKKIKNYLQIGNKLHVNYSSKNENRIGYFKIEILNAYSPLYFDHKQKLSCITTATNLIKILTADSQANNKVYDLINNLFLISTNLKIVSMYWSTWLHRQLPSLNHSPLASGRTENWLADWKNST